MTMDATLFARHGNISQVKARELSSDHVAFTIYGDGGHVTLFTDNMADAKALVSEMGKALDPLLKGS